MSVMGPRPPLESEIIKYEPRQLRRLSVKPGITCIWQVTPNRNNIKFENWVSMDLKYIDNWSLKLDFILFFRTIYSMINQEGH
jgi:lipopolysaccharide/colanic/teichoic acid biosynthesis glycosyltransferase